MITLALITTLVVSVVEVPDRPAGRVNDYARVLSPEVRRQVEAALAVAEARTSNQLVVVTLPSLDGEEIADVGYRVGRTWGIGQRGRDNGVLLLVAVAERRVRIEVGKGLEGALTDLESKIIIDEVIGPELVRGRFEVGLARGAEAIVQAVEGEFQGQGRVSAEGREPRRGVPVGGLIVIGLLVLLFFVSPRTGMLVLGSMMMMGGRRGGGRGGGFSGGGGSFGGGGASGSW